MAFWLGAFSKIQSMFTNALSPNSLGKKQNLRLQRKYPHLLPQNCRFQGVYLENLSLYLCKSRFLRKSSPSKAKIQNMFTTSPLTQQPWKMPKLNRVSENILYLIALAASKFVGAFQKILSYKSLGKGKTAPPFSNFTARKQKEKAAIAAWQSRFDSGFYVEYKELNVSYYISIL